MAKTMKSNPMGEYAQRWRASESMSGLHTEAVTAGHFDGKRGKFRRAIIAILGGKAAFTALRAEGAGGKKGDFGGRRATGGAVQIDDSKVKGITPKTGRLRGWTTRHVRAPVRVKFMGSDGDTQAGTVSQITADVYVSPKGNEYVNAKSNEKADLIIHYRVKHGALDDSDVRLRRFSESRVAKKLERTEALVEQGQAALDRKKASRRAKKLARNQAKKKARTT